MFSLNGTHIFSQKKCKRQERKSDCDCKSTDIVMQNILGYPVHHPPTATVTPCPMRCFLNVETQNLASHKKVKATRICNNQIIIIMFLHCETQNLASLLFANSVIKLQFMLYHYSGVSL